MDYLPSGTEGEEVIFKEELLAFHEAVSATGLKLHVSQQWLVCCDFWINGSWKSWVWSISFGQG